MTTLLSKIISIFVFIILISLKNVFATPKITIQNLPQQVYKNEEFSVTFDITSNTPSFDSYYIKGRVGSSSATLNQGETYNSVSNTWLSDTAAWNSFPFMAFLNSSIATSTVSLRAKSTAFTGNNYLTIRLNRNSTSYDSSASALLVLDPLPTSTPTISPSPIETLTLSPTDSPVPTPISYKNIYISELLANPLSGENEWIELFNNNDFSVSLTNWFIDDIENGGSSPKLFSINIPSKNYGVIGLSSSMFNNTGDSVRLLDFNKNLINSFEYSSTAQGKTLGRISFDSDEFCLQESTKGFINASCINPTPTPQPAPTKIPTPIKIPTILSVTAVRNNTTIGTTNYSNFILPVSQDVENGEVLGTYTKSPKTKRPITYLSLTSFSYSLLTIISLFLKMKKGI